MTRPAAGFLSVALLAATSGCGRHSATGVSVDSAFRHYVAPDTQALGEVRIDKLITTPFYARHVRQFNLKQLDNFAEQTGFDPRRDVSDLLITWNGKQPLAMARGRLQQQELERKLKTLGAQPVPYRNYTLFGTAAGTIVFLKAGVVMAGQPDLVRGAIDQAANGGGGVPADLEQRLTTVPSGDQVWAVSHGVLPVVQMPLRSDIQSALSNVVGFINGTTVGVGFDTGVHFEADLTCISEEGAKRVNDAVRGSIGLARLMTKDNELDLLRLYDSVNVTQDRSAVHLRMDLEAGLADRIFDRLADLRGRTGELLERR